MPAPTLDLTSIQYLILEVLAARTRLGEAWWPFPNRYLPALRDLEERGLVSYQAHQTPGTQSVSLTGTGRDLCLSNTYVPPSQDPTCRSFYFGSRTAGFRVDCRLPRHTGLHEHRYPGDTLPPVTWTDADHDALVAST